MCRSHVRLIILLATMAFHAFFGLSLFSGTEILAPSWWADLQLTDQAALLADQQRGGAIAWGVGEVSTLLLALGVAVSWRKDDERAGHDVTTAPRTAPTTPNSAPTTSTSRNSAADPHADDGFR